MPNMKTAEVADMLRSFDLPEDVMAPVVNSIHADEKQWVDFMMRFESGLEERDPERARNRTTSIIARSSNNFASISEDRPGERNRCVLFDLGFIAPDEEHVALLVESRFRLFRRKDDLLGEGVAAVFGLTGGVAELMALGFHGDRFTPADAASWLVERGFAPLLFIPITGTDRRPVFDAPPPAQVGRAGRGTAH